MAGSHKVSEALWLGATRSRKPYGWEPQGLGTPLGSPTLDEGSPLSSVFIDPSLKRASYKKE